MPRLTAPLLLVGSITGQSARDVMMLCGQTLGRRLELYPDGETGIRGEFIQGLAFTTYYGHPDLEVVQRPATGWRPSGYHDLWKFRIKAGVTELRFPRLSYASEAIRSYEDFRALKDEGVIPAQARFLVALPLIDTAAATFVVSVEDYGPFRAAVSDALKRELGLILESIPQDELAIQWDCPLETLAVATAGSETRILPPWLYGTDPLGKFEDALEEVCEAIPHAVILGLHLCYGDLGQRHVVEPEDLSVVTTMANRAVSRLSHPIDYVHVPVPRERQDDAYFAPLQELALPVGRLYLGLIHESDTAERNTKRIATARRHLPDFGISTECGFGRRPANTIPTLLQLHRELADQLPEPGLP